MNNWIYKTDATNSARFLLGEKGSNPLIVFGVNPSVAEPDYLGGLDPTIRKIKMLSKALKFDGWMMLNLYPVRATNPNDLSLVIDETSHAKNLEVIRKVLEMYPKTKLVAAWGNIVERRDYLKRCLQEVYHLSSKYGVVWVCFEINKSNHPKHPLYVSQARTRLTPYDIKRYYKL